MARLDNLKQKVVELYAADNPEKDIWADWLSAQHVPVVAKFAADVAKRVAANAELAEASAWLHDIADAMMARFSPDHDTQSQKIARQIMQDCGYSEADIAIVVDDALPLHGCRDGQRPKTLEGQVLATADALAHLTTDYYVHTANALGYRLDLEEIKAWTVKKSTRDFNDKICFDDIRESVRKDYEAIQNLFSRPSANNTI